MSIPRFQISPGQIIGNAIILDKKESHHARNVLRLRTGDVVELFDGKGNEFSGVVAGIENGLVSVAVNKNYRRGDVCVAPTIKITLAPAVIKPDRMEWLIEKACELGVWSIQPILTERTVIKLSKERREKKIGRWQKIAEESCKQCGQNVVPSIEPIKKFDEMVSTFKNFGSVLIPTLAVEGRGLKESAGARYAMPLLVLIGPEGDFTKKEAELAVSNGAKAVSLGPLIMRTETAALYVLAALNFSQGENG